MSKLNLRHSFYLVLARFFHLDVADIWEDGVHKHMIIGKGKGNYFVIEDW